MSKRDAMLSKVFGSLALAFLIVGVVLTTANKARANTTCTGCVNDICFKNTDVQKMCTRLISGQWVLDSSCVARFCGSYCRAKGYCSDSPPAAADCGSEECVIPTGQTGTLCTNNCFGRSCNSNGTSICVDAQQVPTELRQKYCLSTEHVACECKNPCW